MGIRPRFTPPACSRSTRGAESRRLSPANRGPPALGRDAPMKLAHALLVSMLPLAGCGAILGADFDRGAAAEDGGLGAEDGGVGVPSDGAASADGTVGCCTGDSDASGGADAPVIGPDGAVLAPRIVLFGGWDGMQTIFDDTWEFDGAAWNKKVGLSP